MKASTSSAVKPKFEVGLGLRQIAHSCSIGLGTAYETCSGPKLPRSRGRLGRSGTVTGWKPRAFTAGASIHSTAAIFVVFNNRSIIE